jgi:PAS domain S-box-containing protein
VSKARSFAGDVLRESGLDGLVDDCQLLVSELVTNVVLHAGTDIELRCVTTPSGVRFEVRDGSSVLPGIRHYDVTSATGRGIGLVEAISTRWGASLEPHGKVVWFEIGQSADGANAAPSVDPVRTDFSDRGFLVCFERLPVALVRATVQHGDALLREVALLDMRANADPRSWRTPQIDLTPVLAHVDDAHSRGVAMIDVEVRFPPGARSAALERLARINDAEKLAETSSLSTPAGIPELSACRTWLLSEIALQAEGVSPTPWELPDNLESLGDVLTLTPGEQRELQQAQTALVVADASHRIVFVSAACGVLLGWTVDDLIGRRLSVLVPAERRDAHLAGFARYALTKQPRLIGQTVLVPVLRGDGSAIELTLTLRKVTFMAGDAFVAQLEEPSY